MKNSSPTSSKFEASQMSMSMFDSTAAEASSIVFAVVGVNFLIPKKEIISTAVKF